MPELPSLSAGAEELLRRACTELSRRLRAGETCQAETFLQDFPSLASDPRLALDLIVTEHRVRQQLGQQPDPQELFRRFPQWHEQLRHCLESLEAPTGNEDSARTPLHEPLTSAGSHSQGTVSALPPELGPHEVGEELGHGGMGVVFRARDLVLDRPVALKVLRSGLLASSVEVERFYREARASARLRHAHIVPIHGMGLYQGQHCFTMPLLTGGTLSRQLPRLRQDLRAGVALLEKVARAVHAAHEQGVIHRDLKPSNILLDEQGEPHVSDFGLAKLLDAPTDSTTTGQMLGTPAYMAPEQASGQSGKATAATDVWALGVILYEMLVGQRPWKGATVAQITPQVLHDEPPRPRKRRLDIPRALEAIVVKCLEKDPARRYATASALANDLRSWLAGQRVSARLPSRWRGLRRFGGRHAVALLTVLLGVSLLAFVGLRTHPRDRTLSFEEQVEQQMKQIEAGETVVLVGASGPPSASRWVVEPATLIDPRANNRWFTFHSMTLTEMELLPRVPRTSYRFRAQVRHEDSARMGRVGIFCLRCPRETPQGTEHMQVDLTFNEHDGHDRDRGDPKKIPQNAVFHMRRFRTTGGPGSRNDTGGPLPRALPTLQRQAREQAHWHDLVLEVRPDRLRALVDGVEVGVLSLQDQAMHQGGLFNFQRPPDVPPVPSPHGGLGLFVHRGAAAFREVLVEPLDNGK